MITREEYNKALDIVEEYHRQTKRNAIQQKTDIPSFIEHHKQSMSIRLLNILIAPSFLDIYTFRYIEDITKQQFLKHRNAGPKTWTEFTKLRGY